MMRLTDSAIQEIMEFVEGIFTGDVDECAAGGHVEPEFLSIGFHISSFHQPILFQVLYF